MLSRFWQWLNQPSAGSDRRSRKPTVEALEERALLNGNMMDPGSSASDALALGIATAQRNLVARVNIVNMLASLDAAHSGAPGAQQAIGKLLLRERGLARLMRSLERHADRSDPVFAQVSADFHQLDHQIVMALAELSNYVRP
jgi:hypothetical protein